MPSTLVVTNDFPPRIGGIESFLASACALLDEDVVVYASGPAGAADSDARLPYPVVRAGPLLVPTPQVARRAADLLVSHGATRVLIGAAAPLGLLAPALRRAGARTVVALTHGHEVWWATLPGARDLLRRVGDDCDHLTTISAFTATRIAPALSPAARTRMLRLAPPLDVDLFAPADTVAPPRVVAVARFVRQKGLDTLLRAWRLVRADLAGPAELALIGDGPQRPALQRLTGRLGLADSVRFLGALDRDGVVAQLQRSSVFALPVSTRLCGLNPEGLGLAALEAAGCGLPVLVGSSGGAPETVRHGVTGWVLPSEDEQAWARRIRQLLTDPAEAAAMGARGRVWVGAQFGTAAARTTLRRALKLERDGG